MSAVPRLIPRREVLAFITLAGGEEVAPDVVQMRDCVLAGVVWHAINVEVSTLAAVHFWMDQFGHQPGDLDSWPSSDGKSTCYRSQGETGGWRGCTAIVAATIPNTPPVELDDATREQLAALAHQEST